MTTRIEADWLTADTTQAVLAMLTGAGHRACAVGGCVRNTLLGVDVADIDIATDARPETVGTLAEAAGFRSVPTGIDHGTVTVVADGHPYEITTFRRDVETDGRRAVVAFTDDIAEDARRRDFTMNALYVDPDGTIIDPLHGMGDLLARRVRFIEDAEARIREDYLRSLRFFRFHAQYGDPEAGLDPDALAAIAATLDGLGTLPGERIGAEMRKLLSAPDPGPALASMKATGVLNAILPGADTVAIAPLVHLERAAGQAPSAIRRLVALGGEDVGLRLRLSRDEERSRSLRTRALAEGTRVEELAWRHGIDTAWDVALLAAAMTGAPVPSGTGPAIAAAAAANFPVSASDFLSEVQGPALGALLNRLERAWIDSGFALTRGELMDLARKEG